MICIEGKVNQFVNMDMRKTDLQTFLPLLYTSEKFGPGVTSEGVSSGLVPSSWGKRKKRESAKRLEIQ